MSVFTKYLKEPLSDEELERYSKQLIVAKLDRDKRKEWERKLREEYTVERTAPKNTLRFLLPAIAASILLILALLAIPYYTTPSYLSIVEEEISNLSIMSDQSVLRKGKQDIEAIRKEASTAYVKEDYDSAILLLQQITASPKVVETDCFYLGICYLKKAPTDPKQSIQWLTKARALNPQKYREEIAWVLALAYLKAEEKAKARQELQTIISNYRYKASEAKSILDLLNEEPI